jgi:hypothetical protein
MRKLLAITLGVALAWVGTVALASRNSSGTYSLPAGNPVSTGATITASWANGTLSDLSSEVTNSMDRYGRGGMLAPMRTPDGTLAAPAHSFTSETGTGLYRESAGVMSAVVTGGKVQGWTTTAAAFPLEVTMTKSGDQSITKSGSGNLTIYNSVAAGNLMLTAGAGGTLVAGSTVSMGGKGITNLLDPVSDQDAATKAYVTTALATPSITWNALSVTGTNCTGTNSPAYAKVNGVVFFRGSLVSTASAGVTCTLSTVGAGYRPATIRQIPFMSGATPSFASQSTSGVWSGFPVNAAYTVVLDQLSYPAEQ